MGVSRSATIILAYLMHYKYLSLDEALAKLVAARNVVHPNDGFMAQLRALETEVVSLRMESLGLQHP